MSTRVGKSRRLAARQTDARVHEALPIVGQKLDPVPLQDRDEEEHDTVIDVLSADIVDAYDIADAPALTPPRLPAGVTIKLPREEECVESDTTVYKDGMLKELLEIQAREHLVGRSAGGRGKR